jgi:hypothetical protein
MRYIVHMKLITFFIRWYSQNLSIPFWVVGHVHLSLNIYEDWKEYGTSIIMHLTVALGFYLDWKDHKKT